MANDAHGGGGLPQLNVDAFEPQLIWLAITFIVLYLLMSKIALPRIGEVLEERRDRIQRDLDEAEQLKADTERAIAEYEQALATARGKAHDIASTAREAMNAEIDAKRREIEAQIAARTSEAEAAITKTKSEALARVNEIASGASQEIVAQLIGESVSSDEVGAAIAGSSTS